MAEPLKIFLSTGEVSGDVVGAFLSARILSEHPGTLLFGLGGARMKGAGVEIDFETNHLGTVGISEAFSKIPALARAVGQIRRRLRTHRPDAAVLIGNDVFNVLLGRWLRRQGIPTISYFPPQVWIWRTLARTIGKSFDLILASFPEEQRVYEATGTRTSFVGHYLCNLLALPLPGEQEAIRARLGLFSGAKVVGLLPGSRAHEIDALAGILLGAAQELLRKDPSLQFLLPVAEPLYAETIRAEITSRKLDGAIRLVDGGESSHDAMRASDLLLTASGTATLEASLLGVPMVVMYQVAPLTSWVVRSCIGLGWIESNTVSLPSLVLGRSAVPEMKQREVTSGAVAQSAWDLLSHPERLDEMRRDLFGVRERLESHATMSQVSSLVVSLAAEVRSGRSQGEVPSARRSERLERPDIPVLPVRQLSKTPLQRASGSGAPD